MSQDQVLLERAVIFCLYKQGTFDGSYFGDSPRLKAGKICTNPGKEHPVRTHDNPESLEEKGGINQKGPKAQRRFTLRVFLLLLILLLLLLDAVDVHGAWPSLFHMV